MEHFHNFDSSGKAKGCGAGRCGDDAVIDVEVEEIAPDTDFRPGASASRPGASASRPGASASRPGQERQAGPDRASPDLAQRFNPDTEVHGQSLAQLAVHSLWIVDYVRGLGQTEMADGDLDSLVRCADDLENAITLMFQLAGGTRMELHQRYQNQRLAIFTQATGRDNTGRDHAGRGHAGLDTTERHNAGRETAPA